MPYLLTFKKALSVRDDGRYINECCFGGDFVVERIRPVIEGHYEALWTDQEDWGWFMWFRGENVRLAVDIFCDDPEKGEYRVHITSSKKRWFFFGRVVDTEELDALKGAVVERLGGWTDTKVEVTRLDSDYIPVDPGESNM
ncbi:MAG: hypothetical protein ACYTFG_10675 [Planctomycetota bacterium]|jgi:hypothetical protein